MPQIILKKLKGVNGTQAEMLLEPGVASNLQNVRNRPVDNWVKRNGVEPVLTQASPILGIFDVELDGLIIPMYQYGDTLVFFPNIESPSMPNPDPYPLFDPLDPGGNAVLFLLEPSMRAIQERFLRAHETEITWPNGNISSTTTCRLFFNPDGSLIDGTNGISMSDAFFNGANLQVGTGYDPTNTNQCQFPINNLYRYDLAYMDAYLGQAFGTRASQLVKAIRTQIENLLAENKYMGDPEGQSSMPVLDEIDIALPAVPTVATYRSCLANMKNSMRLLKRVGVSVSSTTSINTRVADEDSLVSCAIAKANAITEWNSNSWSGSTTGQIGLHELTRDQGAFDNAQLRSQRGSLTANMTAYSSTGINAYWFLKLTAWNAFGSSNSPVAQDGLFHQFEAATLGASTSTSTMANEIPTFGAGATCPVSTLQSGWILAFGDSQFVVFYPTFTNNF